jgi:hypothetical protein
MPCDDHFMRADEEARLTDIEPIRLRPQHAGEFLSLSGYSRERVTAFDRQELSQIFRLYGRMVAAGEWRDYALDMGSEKAVFSVFRRASEWPIYRIEKIPKLARKQGAYCVVAATGLILKRGHELSRVIGVLDKSLKSVD